MKVEATRVEISISTKFRCVRDSFIRGKNVSRRYKYKGTRPLDSKRSLVSFRATAVNTHALRGKFRRRYQRESRKGCTRAHRQGAFMSSSCFIPRSLWPCLIVPPVSILHTSLSNAKRVLGLGNNGKFQRTYARKTARHAFSLWEIQCLPVFAEAHRHSVPWNHTAAAKHHRRMYTKCGRFLLFTKDDVRYLFLMQQSIVPFFFCCYFQSSKSSLNSFLLIYFF